MSPSLMSTCFGAPRSCIFLWSSKIFLAALLRRRVSRSSRCRFTPCSRRYSSFSLKVSRVPRSSPQSRGSCSSQCCRWKPLIPNSTTCSAYSANPMRCMSSQVSEPSRSSNGLYSSVPSALTPSCASPREGRFSSTFAASAALAISRCALAMPPSSNGSSPPSSVPASSSESEPSASSSPQGTASSSYQGRGSSVRLMGSFEPASKNRTVSVNLPIRNSPTAFSLVIQVSVPYPCHWSSRQLPV
mmetsp:Transcript_41289/g.67709  ORF Transcript_41289/g.67709 Transcript_41289/m.67709 type:complete len:244 (-) Transcript_41289:428-1159(-)